MNDTLVSRLLREKLGFSKISLIKLRKFHKYLLEYNNRYNLISKNTVNSIWFRHILDSAQIVKFLDMSKKHEIADLGSGAGFPGLILAMYAENNEFHVKLYEKSQVKRNFLKNMMLNLELKNVSLEDNVYKKKIKSDIIVCRAFKKLDEIINISREIIKNPHKLIILKGKNAQSEINNLSLSSNYSYKMERSITDNNSKIIIVEVK
tara:strand:- start:246 stop:863 length:618 start_codon:yes stop_codon:yes gene_type:complete